MKIIPVWHTIMRACFNFASRQLILFVQHAPFENSSIQMSFLIYRTIFKSLMINAIYHRNCHYISEKNKSITKKYSEKIYSYVIYNRKNENFILSQFEDCVKYLEYYDFSKFPQGIIKYRNIFFSSYKLIDSLPIFSNWCQKWRQPVDINFTMCIQKYYYFTLSFTRSSRTRSYQALSLVISK